MSPSEFASMLDAARYAGRPLTAVETAQREVDRLSVLVRESETLIARAAAVMKSRRDELCSAEERLQRAIEDAKPKCPCFGDTVYWFGLRYEPRLVLESFAGGVLLVDLKQACVTAARSSLADVTRQPAAS